MSGLGRRALILSRNGCFRAGGQRFCSLWLSKLRASAPRTDWREPTALLNCEKDCMGEPVVCRSPERELESMIARRAAM